MCKPLDTDLPLALIFKEILKEPQRDTGTESDNEEATS
jgi:hypothetical protein